MRILLWIVALLPVALCQAQTADTVHIFFDTDDPFLNSAAQKQIDKFSKKIPGGTTITVIGYADFRGDVYYNDMLAMRRAQSTAARLEQNGIDRKSMKLVMGKGEVKRKEERRGGYAEDRRVDIVVQHVVTIPPPAPVAKPVKKDTVKKVAPPPVLTADNIEEVEVGQSLKLDRLYFVGGRDIVKPGSEKALFELYQLMKKNPKIKIQIEGHVCCTRFDEEDGEDLATGDMNLSEMRAKAVYKYLVEKGIDKDRMKYKGMARTMPVTRDESTIFQSDLNRRVEIRILEK
jgi:outer membrane protein OmpA-like peptidoglycan-associated protein